MELEHRFEVPVGIESAWPSLLDMSQVAQCFPGATLTSADGDTYTGSVKVKLGPIQLTYLGKARIVEADESAHRAVIEASGSASRSASTATMTVTATAAAVAADRTAVDMVTNLTITGRPAQFGRGVMVEVGNKILGQFADCLSSKLAAGAGVDAGAGSAPGSAGTAARCERSDGQGSATVRSLTAERRALLPRRPVRRLESLQFLTAPRLVHRTPPTLRRPLPRRPLASSATAPAAGADVSEAQVRAGDPAGGAEPSSSDPGPRHAAAHYTRSPEPIDLLGSAGPSIVKRVVPLILAVIALIVLRSILRRHRHDEG